MVVFLSVPVLSAWRVYTLKPFLVSEVRSVWIKWKAFHLVPWRNNFVFIASNVKTIPDWWAQRRCLGLEPEKMDIKRSAGVQRTYFWRRVLSRRQEVEGGVCSLHFCMSSQLGASCSTAVTWVHFIPQLRAWRCEWLKELCWDTAVCRQIVPYCFLSLAFPGAG